jgi:hypothetical protein
MGEVVMARRSPVDRFVRAVVLSAHRNKDGHVRIKVQWLEDDPGAGVPHDRPRKPIVANETGWVISDPAKPPLIKQIDEGSRG